MSIDDAPAGGTGGQSGVSGAGELEIPERLRVHALARLVGRTSKEVLNALGELGHEVRSVQSSVTRATAQQVLSLLGAAEPQVAPGVGEQAATPAAAAPAERSSPEQPSAGPAPDGIDPADMTPATPDTPADPTPEDPPAPAPAPAPDTAAADTDVVLPEIGEVRLDNGVTPDTGAPGPSALAPVFNAAPMFRPPAAPAAPAPASSETPAAAADEAEEGRKKPSGKSGKGKRSRKRDAEAAPEPVEPVEASEQDAEQTDDTADDAGSDDDDENGNRRRRRRGRRGRGRGRGADGEENGEGDADDADDAASSDDDSEQDSDGSDGASDDDSDSGPGGSRRRRRRRRRGGSDGSDDRGDDDPPNTVTKVRQPRDKDRDKDKDSDSGDDGVQSVRGSTRLEAKRQRRRDGRDAGRRRPPILSESEFLARRESVDRSMVIRQTADRTEVGVLEDDVLVEHFITSGRSGDAGMVGNIYLGRVQNVLPSMEAAFVDIGRGRNAVLYAGEVNWDAAGLNGKARKIEQALSSGDQILVQVTKDPVGHKGARLTTQISLAGRFLVYVPSGSAAGISRKLPDTERKRLKDMLKEIVPADAGVIIRTASEGVSHEALERDVRRLQAQWDVIREKSEKTGKGAPKAPSLLYEEPDMLVKVVRDQFNEDFSRLIVSGDDAWDTVSGYVGHVASELADRMHRHVGPSDVFTEHRIDEQLLKALDRKVWLPSGGTLVIDRTEAMTVVDVNTGKFTGSGGNLEETVTRNNLEAAEEVVRQMRLRDIGGIIVVDFIDMVLEANRDLVLRRLTECLARDRTRHQVAEVTSLGLVQMTRKRVGGGLLEHFSTPCEHCRGRGVVISTDGAADGGHQHQGPGQQNGHHGNNGGGNGHNGNGNGGDGGGRRSRSRGRRGGGDRGGAVEVDTSSAVAGVALIGAASRGRADTATAETPDPAGAAAVPETTVATDPAGITDTGTTPATGDTTVVDAAPAPQPGPAARVPELVDEPVAAGSTPVALPERHAPGRDGAEAAPNGTGNHSGADGTGDHASADGTAPPAPRRRRVSRSAGAPSASVAEPVVITTSSAPGDSAPGDSTAGDSTVVISTPGESDSGTSSPDEPGAAQPQPAAVATRTRRTRRAASRPAGPPVDAPGDGADTGGETDPV